MANEYIFSLWTLSSSLLLLSSHCSLQSGASASYVYHCGFPWVLWLSYCSLCSFDASGVILLGSVNVFWHQTSCAAVQLRCPLASHSSGALMSSDIKPPMQLRCPLASCPMNSSECQNLAYSRGINLDYDENTHPIRTISVTDEDANMSESLDQQ